VINGYTNADLGTSTTTIYNLEQAPIIAGTLTGTILVEGTPVQTFSLDAGNNFTFTTIGSASTIATAGSINLGTGVVTLTWNYPPQTNQAQVSYQGLPIYKQVSMLNFGVSCPPPYNPLCNPTSAAYVAAVTVCDQALNPGSA
jgi:hypothetical protein